MSRKNVVIWKRSWLPSSETFIRNQVSALSSWRATCVGISRVEGSLASDTDEILFDDSFRDWVALRLLTITGRSPRIEASIRQAQAQLVHAHFAPEAVKIYRLARHMRLPLVVTVHGHDVTAGAQIPGIRGALYRARARRMFKAAHKVIAVSEFIRERAIEMGAPRGRTTVEYIGIPVSRTSPRASDLVDVQKKWDIAFVGRLVAKKGVMDLLEAVRRLDESGREINAVIVGSGPLEAELKAFASRNHLNVHFAGHQTQVQVRETLSAARIFCGPSQTSPDGDSEGFGLVFLEAASRSLPVVAYKHGGVPEAVVDQETGLLSDEGDITGLVSSLTRLLDDEPLRRSLGANALQRLESSFDIDSRTRSLERLYDQVTEGRIETSG
ncbi:glycosyltransferase [Herbiconiux sp. P16]|uniref:glycosyltransferase n=1 Tax=Herbiconiux wuyangfengii TaxID=3342794 RepID=UPI0035BA7C06